MALNVSLAWHQRPHREEVRRLTHRKQPIDVAHLLLAVPPHTSHGLFIVSRIPVWVKHNQPVSPDQIQTAAACFAA